MIMRGEIFSRLGGRDYRDVLATAFAPKGSVAVAVGFKIFYYHANDDESKAVWDDLVKMTDLRVIHLKRRNKLRTLISRKIASLEDQWHIKGGADGRASTSVKQVRFSAAELESKLEETRRWEELGAAKFVGHPILDVYYEDLASERPEQCNRIASFLGVEPYHAHTNLVKQNPEPISQLLENYDDLYLAFKGTRWECLFVE